MRPTVAPTTDDGDGDDDNVVECFFLKFFSDEPNMATPKVA